jgi:hypothetical protein
LQFQLLAKWNNLYQKERLEMKKHLSLLFCFLFSMTAICQADSIDIKKLPQTVKWAAHLDVEKFKASSLCNLIMQELNNQEVTERVIGHIESADHIFGFNPVRVAEELRAQGIVGTLEEGANTAELYLGFNPLRDITGVTMYGSEFKPKQGVILLTGAFKTENMIALLNTDPSHVVHSYDSYEIHEWVSPCRGRNGFTAFYNDNLIVLGSSLEYVHESLDVIDGRAGNISSNLTLQTMPDVPAGAIFVAAAVQFSQEAATNPQSAILSQMDEVSVAIGEVGQTVYIDLGMNAQTEEIADQTIQFVNGMLAFAEMNRQNNPLIADLAGSIQTDQDGTTLKLSLEGTTEDVFTILKKIREAKQKTEVQAQEEN